jgi:nitroreductase
VSIVEETVTSLDSRTETVLSVIRGRRSVGKFTSNVPTRTEIETVLEAATWAPCHHITDPWRFVVLTGGELVKFADLMGQTKLDRLTRLGRETEGEYERARNKALRAPVVIAVGVEPSSNPKVVEIEEIEAGAAAVQNMLLVAQSLGLATTWKTGDPAYDLKVKTFLGFPANAHIIGFIYLGYPDAAPSRARHTPHHAITTWRGWT